ncbi:DNA-directed RNA polymerase subunit beta [Paenibacillus sp. PAMC21692]|uniref:DNA-directed RNA polymerase subunit beta n=1 Tax=Paenibacillus sp. PAMC21692 TaxID=2762320 RepID=UPI00164E1BA0|nr:DNA-directed RNA polymerase subunit beta [Paenibacillus sp. PAMC21692]QNK58331.1 DNA-directed RNA polymerase subunit beta [Paenibacillus sp. PAMC21692]
MADERRDSSRIELEDRPAPGGVRAGGATAELRTPMRSSGLSRMERHGGSSSSSSSSTANDQEKEVPAKKAKLTFGKRKPAEPVKLEGPVKPERSAKPEKPVNEPEWDEEAEEEREYPRWAVVSFWLFRKSIVPVVMIVMLIVGLYAGYVFLGDAPKDEVFKWSTWQHLYDLVFAES